MDSRENTRKRRVNGNLLLLAVMIGFCILAIIEIVYGQAQIKMERERLALEEENRQTVQELQAEWNQLKGDPNVGAESLPAAGGGQNGNGGQGKTVVSAGDAPLSAQGTAAVPVAADEVETPQGKMPDMQIVFLGDSILDTSHEYGGVAALVADACNALVYNMAMGGTTAALLPYDHASFDNWNSRSLLGVVHAIVGDIDGSIFEGYRAGDVLGKCDFSQTDYFVIEYGVNDFLSQVPISLYLEDGTTRNVDSIRTYAGALDASVTLLHNAFPDAKILMISPHFCQIFNGETFVGDSYSIDYGYGPMVSYARVCGYVAEQHKEDGVMFYNAMEESGIDAYNSDRFLEDGVHLSVEGEIAYADLMIRLIKGDFFPEE